MGFPPGRKRWGRPTVLRLLAMWACAKARADTKCVRAPATFRSCRIFVRTKDPNATDAGFHISRISRCFIAAARLGAMALQAPGALDTSASADDIYPSEDTICGKLSWSPKSISTTWARGPVHLRQTFWAPAPAPVTLPAELALSFKHNCSCFPFHRPRCPCTSSGRSRRHLRHTHGRPAGPHGGRALGRVLWVCKCDVVRGIPEYMVITTEAS